MSVYSCVTEVADRTPLRQVWYYPTQEQAENALRHFQRSRLQDVFHLLAHHAQHGSRLDYFVQSRKWSWTYAEFLQSPQPARFVKMPGCLCDLVQDHQQFADFLHLLSTDHNLTLQSLDAPTLEWLFWFATNETVVMVARVEQVENK